MPLPVYEKVFSATEKGFISETYENLCCLESFSKNFTPKCVRTLDRGVWLWLRTHSPAFQHENAGEEKTVPHHHQNVSTTDSLIGKLYG